MVSRGGQSRKDEENWTRAAAEARPSSRESAASRSAKLSAIYSQRMPRLGRSPMTSPPDRPIPSRRGPAFRARPQMSSTSRPIPPRRGPVGPPTPRPSPPFSNNLVVSRSPRVTVKRLCAGALGAPRAAGKLSQGERGREQRGPGRAAVWRGPREPHRRWLGLVGRCPRAFRRPSGPRREAAARYGAVRAWPTSVYHSRLGGSARLGSRRIAGSSGCEERLADLAGPAALRRTATSLPGPEGSVGRPRVQKKGLMFRKNV